MTRRKEIELQLQTAEKINEQIQNSLFVQTVLIFLTALLIIIALLVDNMFYRAIVIGLALWTVYQYYIEYRISKANRKILRDLADKAELLLRDPTLNASILSKEMYKMRIDRLKS